MITRQGFYHPGLMMLARSGSPGTVRTTEVKGITHTWALSRPTGSFTPDGAPFYLSGRNTGAPLIRTGTQAIRPARPKVAMDPSDSSTWQRRYSF